MEHLDAIDAGLAKSLSHDKIARKVFLTYPTKAFMGKEELQYEILDEVAEKWGVPITSIHVAGSAQIGVSIHKGTPFTAGTSDLDLAIIDGNLFVRYMEAVLKQTRGYTDMSEFPRIDGSSYQSTYLTYITKGMLRPDCIPASPLRADWTNFFGRLSKKNVANFKSISAMIYLSERFFESKQRSVIKARLAAGVVK